MYTYTMFSNRKHLPCTLLDVDKNLLYSAKAEFLFHIDVSGVRSNIINFIIQTLL